MKSSCCCIYHSQFLSPSSVYNKSHFLMTLLFLPNALNTHEKIYIYTFANFKSRCMAPKPKSALTSGFVKTYFLSLYL